MLLLGVYGEYSSRNQPISRFPRWTLSAVGSGGRANQFRAGVALHEDQRLSWRTLTPTTTLEGHFLSDSPRFQQINPVLCGYYTESESDGETTQPAQVRSLLEQICKTEGRLKAR
jgi:hypothetical protein